MMGEKELEDFFSHIEEISQDSSCTDQFQQIQKLKNENNRLKITLSNLRSSTREVLNIVRNERQYKLTAIQELEKANLELNKLRNSYDELDKTNVNNQFTYKEHLDELELKHRDEHHDYIELAQDYFNVLSEATTFYNFEIKRNRNKILCKASKFLENTLGDKFQKPKLVIKRSLSISETKSTASKRSRCTKEKLQNSKKRKFDIWEMKSISEASSPMSFHEVIEETTENQSDFSFNTFSIGNETAFTSLANKKFTKSVHCKCHIIAKDPDLVSIGVNTEEETELPRSMPLFSDDNPLNSQDDDLFDSNYTNEITAVSDILDNPEPQPIENIENNISESLPAKNIETISIGTSTDFTEAVKQTRDQSTSYNHIEKSHKSTSTVHSVTHRGTMTPARVTRNIGIQFPDITFEKILEEMSFELPSCINPIIDEIENIENLTKETQTDLHNVNREVCYHLSSDDKKSLSNEEQSFIILGQTVFNLFMNRLRETNKSLNDDAHTRQRLREQLLDRFDELTFDEYFSPSFVNAEAQESVLRKVFEDVRDVKDQIKSNYEEESDDINAEMLGEEITQTEEDENSKNVESSALSQRMEITQSFEEENIQSLVGPQKSLNSTNVLNPEMKVAKNSDENSQIEELPLSSQESLSSSNESELTAESCLEKFKEIELIPEIEDICDINFAADNHVDSESQDKVNNNEEKEVENTLESPVSSQESVIKSFSDLEVSSESSSEDNMMENDESCSKKTDQEVESISKILKEAEQYLENIPELLSPIADLTDLIWSSVFPENESENLDDIIDDKNVLDGYDIGYEPLEIPLIGENGTESPHPPPQFAIVHEAPYDPIEIPLDSSSSRQRSSKHGKTLEFDPSIRLKLVTWQQNHHQLMKMTKIDDKRLCKIRKSINEYLNSEWTDENLEKYIEEISNKSQHLLVEAIFESVEDNQWQRDVSSEFTPPAPPLPRYQQKLILLISKLTEFHSNLPHKLVQDLEMRLFKCESSCADLEYLRNMSYYYTALIDLFFNGDPTVAFYFIIKCIYFYGYRAIPMIFVVIKAFPMALPKKSLLLKKYSTNVDWEKMSGLEMSKIRLDLEWMDSLDLCVMYLLTNIQMYRRKGQEFKIIYEHEFFNYLPKMYGFPLSFIAVPKLMDLLIKRLEDGELKNLSMSLILLGKRMNKDFTVRTLLKGKLIPLLKGYVDESLKVEILNSNLIDKICLLIESISTILKPLTDEKEKTFNEVFPMIVNILGRSNDQKVQEYCIKAILRLQRFIENHKEIYEIIKHHYEKQNSFSESLRHAIVTFVHRKKEAYFKE